MQLLTHSRCESFKRCRRRHWWEYEVGLRPTIDARALRMGSAYHAGLDVLKSNGDLTAAVATVRMYYDQRSADEGPDTEMEAETVTAMVSGWQWRWGGMHLEVVASEQSFQLPLRNPTTGAASTIWQLAGKIDGIVRLEDGRLAVLEHKTVSDDLAPDSDWWRRLQMDPQVSLYVIAARLLEFDCATVLYDVARKPTIKPTPIALLDELGAKIVLDANGNRVKTEKGFWRQTGDTAKGYTLQTRPMTSAEWSDKVTADMGERPEWYYVRREIPRLDQDLEECQSEMWEIQRVIREAQNTSRWYRTVSRDTCTFCSFFGLCSNKYDIESQPTPDGFTRTENIHPELNLEVCNGVSQQSPEVPAAAE